MDDKTITIFCTLIIMIGILYLALTYKAEFQQSTIHELKKEYNSKGIIFARVDYVIKNTPITQAIINDGDEAQIYYPKKTDLKKNDFIIAYLKFEDTNTFYAYKVKKDD